MLDLWLALPVVPLGSRIWNSGLEVSLQCFSYLSEGLGRLNRDMVLIGLQQSAGLGMVWEKVDARETGAESLTCVSRQAWLYDYFHCWVTEQLIKGHASSPPRGDLYTENTTSPHTTTSDGRKSRIRKVFFKLQTREPSARSALLSQGGSECDTQIWWTIFTAGKAQALLQRSPDEYTWAFAFYEHNLAVSCLWLAGTAVTVGWMALAC